MNRKQAYGFSLTLLAASVLLSACGGGGSSGSSSQTVSGVVTDPAIQGARVSLLDTNGQKVGDSVVSGADGSFTLSGVPNGSLATYSLQAQGGVDTATGESLRNVALNLSLKHYAEGEYGSVVVSPLTTLLGSDGDQQALATELGIDAANVLANPADSTALMQASMKLMLMRQAGHSFTDINTMLSGQDGVNSADLDSMSDTAARERLANYFALLEGAADNPALAKAYQQALIQRTIQASMAEDIAKLETPDVGLIAGNIQSLADHLQSNAPASRGYLLADDVVSTISAGNGFLTAEELNTTEFDASRFAIKLVDLDASFADTLKLAFYSVDNPLTGNEQLVVHDASTGEQKVVKTDIILGNRAFVFSGQQEGDKTVFAGREYGIFLDPSQSKETRTAPDGRGGTFEYTFYTNNTFKRYEIANPANEAVIYDADMLPQALKDQQMKVLAGDYTLFNNIADAANSYVELKAFESLPDTLRGEQNSQLLHVPVVVRLRDAAMTQGHLIRILKDDEGKSAAVLKFFEAVHKKGVYPTGDDNRMRLQRCSADLGSCTDVTAAGGLGDGKFFFQAENDTYVYMAKNGTDVLYAYHKADNTLSEVTGARYPASFNHKIHTLASQAAHGSGEALLSGFSNLSGSQSTLSDGENAYVRINYDGDATDPVGKYTFLGNIHVYKHSQILKLTGTTAVKMFDNGDGVDHADDSDAENVVGHANLVAVSNGRLFIEIGNYEAGNGGTCEPSARGGYGCSSVYYGYLNTDSSERTELDAILHEKQLLRYFVSRRIAPYAVGDKLYISLYQDSTQPYVFNLYEYDLSSPDTPLSTTAGRTYFTKTAQRDNGIYEGSVLSWDGATGVLSNLSTNTQLGVINNGSVIPGSPAINSVSGQTSGVPVAGIGNLFALKGDPGGHRFYLVAGDVNAENGMEYVDQVPFSSWLYE